MSNEIPPNAGTSALIGKLIDWSPDVYNALRSLQSDVDSLRAILAASPANLASTDVPNTIERLVFPKSPNPPPYANTKEGKAYYSTSRARHGFSTDTWPYYDISTPESIRLYNSADEAIPDVTETKVTFNTTIFKHMLAAPVASVVTIPLDGRYLVGGHVRWENGGGTTRAIYIKKGATYIAVNAVSPVVGGVTDQIICTVYEFAVGDTFQMNAYQDSGGALNIVHTAEFSPILYCHRLG